MAKLIPALNTCLHRMQAGEKRFALRLERLLDDGYLCWYDTPVGNRKRYADFIVVHPLRGLLLLEVKDWKIDTLKRIDKHTAVIHTSTGDKSCVNPLEQARQCVFQLLQRLEADPVLTEQAGRYKGKLTFPYGYGVVLTNISRAQYEANQLDQVLPWNRTICQDEMQENTDPEDFQQCLWNMFEYQFHAPLSAKQVDRIRWHIFPEIRIEQGDLFEQGTLPEKQDVLKVMDLEQEKLARNLGSGHRVIHGVAGSGKTLILLHRCRYLAQQAKKLPAQKPILVLCFNIVLAKKLQSLIVAYGIAQQVRVHHFHGWCSEQLRTFGVRLVGGSDQVYQRQVATVIDAVKDQRIPTGQYSAVLVDEGHDFEQEWLRLIVQMPAPETQTLLFLYDDAQSIYKKTTQLGFSLSDVGIRARGRTAILRLNYRNTDEIFHPAYRIGEQCFMGDKVEENQSVIQPQMAGRHGQKPEFKHYPSVSAELAAICDHLQNWHEQDGQRWSSMCVLYRSNAVGKQPHDALQKAGIPVQWLGSSAARKQFTPSQDAVVLMSMHSSKGLEFSNVIIPGINTLSDYSPQVLQREMQLLYVAMTRATDNLLLTAFQQNRMTRQVQDAFELDEASCDGGDVLAIA